MAQRAVIEVYGEQLVAAELFATGDRATDFAPIWPAVVARLEEIEREQFDSQGARSGNPWEELPQETLWRKFREGDMLAIMRASDMLYQSLTGETADSVRIPTATTYEFGSNLPQFAYHQDRPASANYPERLPIDITEQDETELAGMLLNYVMGMTDKRGRRMPKRGANGRFIKG